MCANFCSSLINEASLPLLHLSIPRMRLIMKLYKFAFVSIDSSLYARLPSHSSRSFLLLSSLHPTPLSLLLIILKTSVSSSRFSLLFRSSSPLLLCSHQPSFSILRPLFFPFNFPVPLYILALLNAFPILSPLILAK